MKNRKKKAEVGYKMKLLQEQLADANRRLEERSNGILACDKEITSLARLLGMVKTDVSSSLRTVYELADVMHQLGREVQPVAMKLVFAELDRRATGIARNLQLIVERVSATPEPTNEKPTVKPGPTQNYALTH